MWLLCLGSVNKRLLFGANAAGGQGYGGRFYSTIWAGGFAQSIADDFKPRISIEASAVAFVD